MMAHNLDGKEGMNPVLDVFSAGDGTIPGVFPGENECLMINPIPVDNSSPAGNETTLHFFGGADEDSSAKCTDELGETENINPIDQDDSSGRYEGIPGGHNDDEAEHDQSPISHPPSIGNDPSSDEDSSSGSYNHPPPMGFVLETRSEPTKRGINRGSSGGGQDDDDDVDENHPSSAGLHETPPLETSSGNKKENSSVETNSQEPPEQGPPNQGSPGGVNR